MGEIQVIQKIKIVPVESGNRFGQISNGHLYLSGDVKKARVPGNLIERAFMRRATTSLEPFQIEWVITLCLCRIPSQLD
jgi:hypothetical protein